MKKFAYFRLTEYTYNPANLYSWYEYLKKTEIPCAIVERNDKNERYSLWRIGKEHTTELCVKCANTEKMEGIAIRKCLGFEKLATSIDIYPG